MASCYSGDHIVRDPYTRTKHVTLRTHNRSTALEWPVIDCGVLNYFTGFKPLPFAFAYCAFHIMYSTAKETRKLVTLKLITSYIV